MNENTVEIELENSRFYANIDEEMMFEWISRMKFIDNIRPSGNGILLEVNKKGMDVEGCQALMALFFRYNSTMKPHTVLEDIVDRSWFRDPGK